MVIVCIAGATSIAGEREYFYVKTDSAPLQMGKEVLARLKRGTKIEAVASKGEWVFTEVTIGGVKKKGWINKRYLLAVPSVNVPNREDPTAETPSPEVKRAGRSAIPGWTQWRGKNRNGKSLEKGLVKRWSDGGPKLLWTAKGCGIGYASLSFGGGLIYTAGNFGSTVCVVAFSIDGKQVWRSEVGRGWTGSYPGSRGTPTYEDGKLYYESPMGEVVCLEARTGRKIWSVNILRKFRGRNISWGLAESVLIDGDRLICQPGGREVGVVALQKQTGKTIWTCRTGDKPGYASPIVFEYKGLRQIVTMTSYAAVGINAKTGRLLWRYEHRTSYDANIPTPIYHDGYVFIDSGYGSGGALLRLNVSGERCSVNEVWTTKALDNHHGGIVLVDGYLYGSSHRGRWVCLDFRTGRVMYSESGVGKGSVIYADGMLYCLSERGMLGLVEATPRGHKVVSRFRIPRSGRGPTWAHPAIQHGTLYIRHGDVLFAFDIKQ